MFKSIVDKEGNRFLEVGEESIIDAQEELEIVLPEMLVQFYKEIGYGFFKSSRYNFNRIFSPQSLCEFRLRKGQFEGDTELEIYDEYEQDKLVFFEICEGNYLLIGFVKNNNGKVFYGNRMIANDLKEFLGEYQKNENYFK